MLADIATGETSTADVVFLIALIVAGIGTVLYLLDRAFAAACVAGGVALVAFGLLLL